jgi:type VI secretion system secreted protein Hcp
MPSDNYLKMEGIDGESTAPGHEGSMEIMSFSVGVSMTTTDRSTSGSPTSGAPHPSDVSVAKTVDSASPLLYSAACKGQPFKEVTISVNRTDGAGGQVEYLQVKMTDVVISSFSQGGSTGGGLPLDTFSLNYGSITFTYTKTSGSDPSGQGNVTGGWDYETNQPT